MATTDSNSSLIQRARSLCAATGLLPLALQAQPLPGNTSQSVALMPVVTITSQVSKESPLWSQSPSGVGHVTVIDAKELDVQPAARIEDVLQSSGLATASASSAFGLAPSVGMRGFSVNTQSGSPSLIASKILLNGHADISNGFTRDMNSVERIEIMGGFDSTLIGAGAPGGTIHYQTKRPQGVEAVQVGVTLASDGLMRATLDLEKHVNDLLQIRLVAASQGGQKTVEGQGTDRDNLLLSSSLKTPVGAFRLELEHQNNRAPYVFGTFYSGGQFWYDKPYVSPQSQASRQYSRAALYWEHALSPDTFIKTWVQQAYAKRDETLVGFWDIKNDTLLNGYYRVKTSDYHQQNLGVSVEHHLQTWGVSHTLTFLAQQQNQALDFNGPQNINGYTISIQNPIWPVDLSALPLSPRTFQERMVETGVAVADSIQLTDKLQLRLGVRRSQVQIDTASNTPISQPTAAIGYLTHSEGLAYQLSAQDTVWLSRAGSFEPVRGQTRDGGYLPPQIATQWELGVKHQTKTQLMALSVFNIEQSNLPAVDPVDNNYLIPLGGIRSQGVTLAGKAQALGLRWQANATWQTAQVTTPVRSTQGNILPGVPRVIAAFKVSTPEKQQGLEGWVSAFGAGDKSADTQGTLYAPGYVRWDAGLAYKQQAWQLNAWVQNLFDLRYIQALDAVDNVWQGARRSVWVSLSYKY